jgi:hypothetical protein
VRDVATMNGVAVEYNVAKESGLAVVELQEKDVTANARVENMHMGMFGSHNILCGDFVVDEVGYVANENKVK